MPMKEKSMLVHMTWERASGEAWRGGKGVREGEGKLEVGLRGGGRRETRVMVRRKARKTLTLTLVHADERTLSPTLPPAHTHTHTRTHTIRVRDAKMNRVIPQAIPTSSPTPCACSRLAITDVPDGLLIHDTRASEMGIRTHMWNMSYQGLPEPTGAYQGLPGGLPYM